MSKETELLADFRAWQAKNSDSAKREKAFLENCQESLRTGKPLTSAIDRANLAEACSYDPKVQELCRRVLWDLDRADAYVEASRRAHHFGGMNHEG